MLPPATGRHPPLRNGPNDPVVFDSWAWVEVLQGSPVGKALWKTYVERRRVVTPALVVSEVTRKLHTHEGVEAADEAARHLRVASRIHPIDDDIAALAGQLHQHLRVRDKKASLADAVVLATARTLALPLISQDPCFAGCEDVRPE